MASRGLGIHPRWRSKKLGNDKISKFSGEYRFLSNFYLCDVKMDGMTYPSVEHAYQAAKTNDTTERVAIRNAASPKDAKHLGYKVSLRPDWDRVKNNVMYHLLQRKFSDPTLRSQLLGTRGKELIEGNGWHDNYWGVCSCGRCKGKGRNVLGKMLMRIRDKE